MGYNQLTVRLPDFASALEPYIALSNTYSLRFPIWAHNRYSCTRRTE